MIEIIRVVCRSGRTFRRTPEFDVAAYRPWLTLDKRWVWRRHHTVEGRMSVSQLRRAGYGCHDRGSLHNRPLTKEEVSQHLCEKQISGR